jgi:hypothetical protein
METMLFYNDLHVHYISNNVRGSMHFRVGYVLSAQSLGIAQYIKSLWNVDIDNASSSLLYLRYIFRVCS